MFLANHQLFKANELETGGRWALTYYLFVDPQAIIDKRTMWSCLNISH